MLAAGYKRSAQQLKAALARNRNAAKARQERSQSTDSDSDTDSEESSMVEPEITTDESLIKVELNDDSMMPNSDGNSIVTNDVYEEMSANRSEMQDSLVEQNIKKETESNQETEEPIESSEAQNNLSEIPLMQPIVFNAAAAGEELGERTERMDIISERCRQIQKEIIDAEQLNEIRRKVELRKLEHIEMLIEKDAIIKDLEIQKLKLEMLRKKDAIIKELEVNKLKLEIEALSK